jgi:hypothetical protein
MLQSEVNRQASIKAHRDAIEAPIDQIARVLQEVLSRRLTAYIAGVGDGKTVSRWANKEVTEIRDHETEQRLRVAYEIAQLLLMGDAAHTVKGWFIGLNPELDDVAPAEAIHSGQLREALAAARAFCIGG